MHYSQPNFYKFSEDSILLSKVALAQCQLLNPCVLDVCAGCGVVGIEYLLGNQSGSLDSVEIQKDYKDHYALNTSEITSDCTFYNMPFRDLLVDNYKSKYDLVLCNPPYFDIKNNRPSPNSKKNTCRLFSIEDFTVLISAIKWCTKPSARAFLLVREGSTFHKHLKGTESIVVVESLGSSLVVELLLNIDCF